MIYEGVHELRVMLALSYFSSEKEAEYFVLISNNKKNRSYSLLLFIYLNYEHDTLKHFEDI